MEALILIAGLTWLALAALRFGADTRPRLDDRPRRSI
jgi:hypothetical protein